ncbi:MAG: Biopolymer transport protein ExbD/TolR [Pseudomonadota bacterium]
MFLLLPFLLLTTSTQRLVGLTLSLPELGGLLPPEPPGRVERVEIEARPEGLRVLAQVRRADVITSAGDTQAFAVSLPSQGGEADLAGLQAQLRALKALDTTRRKLTLRPSDALPGQTVVALMDAARADAQGELFPELSLASLTEPPPETP